VDALAREIDQAWLGADANGFVSHWRSDMRPRVVDLARTLKGLGQSAENNASEQEHASAGTGSVAAGSLNSVHSANPEGHDTYRGGKFGRDRDMLDLADACSDHTVGDGHDKLIPAGWHEVSRSEQAALGIDRDMLGVQGSDFSATLYRDDSGHYVLAFEGTNPGDGRDIYTDVAGANSLTMQSVRAMTLANAVKQQLSAHGDGLGDSLEFTGYSLGGRLAAVASVATGNRAVTFNAAGVNSDDYALASSLRQQLSGYSPPRSDAVHQVTAYTADVDPLSRLQDLTPAPDAFGDRVRLHAVAYDNRNLVVDGAVNYLTGQPEKTAAEFAEQAVNNHGLHPLATGFDKMAVDAGEYYHTNQDGVN
jgi:hypothetical protein